MTHKPIHVAVVTPLGEGGQGGIDRLMDEIRHYIAQNNTPDIKVSFLVSRGQGSLFLSPFLVIKILAGLLFKAASNRPDLLHINLSSHGSTLRKIMIARMAKFLRIPYVIHLHGSSFREYWNSASPFLSKRIKSMFLNAHRILVLGSVWQNYVMSQVPEAAARITILPNAVPAAQNRVYSPSKPVKILFLGHVGARKGVPDLVKALGILPKDESWQAIIAGNGQVEETRAEIAKLGLSNHVNLTGWVGTSQVAKLLSENDVLVLPSYEENLPMSVIEGMAYGLTVITTPVGAVEDIIQPDINGILVPVGDVKALNLALTRVINEYDLRISLGKAAQDFQRTHLETKGYCAALFNIWRELDTN